MAVTGGVVNDFWLVFKESGVVFWDDDQYLDSAFGHALKAMKDGGVMRIRSWQVYDLVLKTTPLGNSNWELYISARARCGKESEDNKLSDHFVYVPVDVTGRILASTTAGSKFWRTLFQSSKLPKLLPELPAGHVPDIPFSYPTDRIQLTSYERWLVHILGSEDKLSDGWGHRIRLTVDDNVSPPLLVASSAGSDGKWGTADDMVVKRDTRTGRIVDN